MNEPRLVGLRDQHLQGDFRALDQSADRQFTWFQLRRTRRLCVSFMVRLLPSFAVAFKRLNGGHQRTRKRLSPEAHKDHGEAKSDSLYLKANSRDVTK